MVRTINCPRGQTYFTCIFRQCNLFGVECKTQLNWSADIQPATESDISTAWPLACWFYLDKHRNIVISCDQAVLWMIQSVPQSFCPSHPFHYVPIIVVITIDRSDVYAKGQGQMSNVKVPEVKTQCSRFRTVTPVWIHIWRWTDAQSLMRHSGGVLLFFNVIWHISSSRGTKQSLMLTRIRCFWTPLWIHWRLRNDDYLILSYLIYQIPQICLVFYIFAILNAGMLWLPKCVPLESGDPIKRPYMEIDARASTSVAIAMT